MSIVPRSVKEHLADDRAAAKERALIMAARSQQARIQWIAEYKLAVGCMDCGYNQRSEALDFDHLPDFEKMGQISCMGIFAKERVLAEIAKCEVVCANCHRIRTRARRKGHRRSDQPVPPYVPGLQTPLPPARHRSVGAKLTADEVLAIRSERERYGTPYKALAESYGVSVSSISMIVRRTSWDWLDDTGRANRPRKVAPRHPYGWKAPTVEQVADQLDAADVPTGMALLTVRALIRNRELPIRCRNDTLSLAIQLRRARQGRPRVRTGG